MQHKALIITQDEDLHQEISSSLQDVALITHHAGTYHAALDNSDDVLKYHIRQIRKKLEAHGAEGLIETSWGVGYQFHIGDKTKTPNT